MAKFRRIIQWFLVFGMLLGLNPESLHARAQDAGAFQAYQQKVEMPINRAAQVYPQNRRWQSKSDIPAPYELVAENDVFQLYADKTTLGFIVVDKRSGYAWHSVLEKPSADDRLNKSWRAFAGSGISVDYLDQKAVSRRISITNSSTLIDFSPIDQGFQAKVTFKDFSITIGVNVILESTGVQVEVPAQSIKEEDPNFKLGLLYVYPFMGATRMEDNVPGYIFIPDGSGSLIRFSPTTKAKNMFIERYYGEDLGIIGTLPYDPSINQPYKISIPVFGMVHGEKQNAFISIGEKGASYGELNAHPAGIITNFNFIYHAFVYNQSYFQVTNRSGDGVTTIQHKTNEFDVKIHFRFLTKEDSDYVGMAKSYQQYLVEKGILKKILDLNPGIGIKLEFLGAEKEKILFWYRSISMTTISQMADILKDLGIKNPDVVYYGWQPYGASSMPPRSLQLDGTLGDPGQLSSLAQNISTGGGNLYLYLDPQAALRDESGYSPRNDLAMSITNENLLGWNRDKVNYYLNIDVLTDRYSTLSKDANNQLKAGLALDGIGSTIYSDFKKNHFLSREDSIVNYQKVLSQNNVNTSFYMPNDYMFGLMKAYYDIPLTDNGYLYTTDVVPFLQIVLAGYVPFYGPALNFSSNTQDDLLRQVDFDVYPSYFLSNDVTAKILNTSSNWIYTSSYQQWGQEIKKNYQWLNNLLGPVKGQSITARQVLQAGVVATTYTNGKQIIVNYNDRPYSAEGIQVNGKDAVIREVLP